MASKEFLIDMNVTGDLDVSGSVARAGAELVEGPGSSTDDVVMLWDGTSGDTAKDSAITNTDLTTLTDGSNADALHVHTGGGGGNVTKVGTPVNNQLGVWTGDGTLEGDADLTWDSGATPEPRLTIVGDMRVADPALVVDSANELIGMGTAAPGYSLHIYGDGPHVLGEATDSANSSRFTAENDGSDFFRMTMFGSTAAGQTLSELNESLAVLYSTGTAMVISQSGVTPIIFGTDDTERMRIDGAGAVTIDETLDVTGDLSTAGTLDATTDIKLAGSELVNNTSYNSTAWLADTKYTASRRALAEKIDSIVAGTGFVTGPATSTDFGIATYDGAGGATLQDNSVTLTAGVLAGASIDGATNTITNVSLATGVTGNIQIANMNGGIGAGSASFWRGDGSWNAIPIPVTTVFDRTGAIDAVAGDYTAADITNVAAGTITSITVQDAINELDTDVQAIVAGTVLGPGSSTDNAVVRWDSTGANALLDSTVTISDTGDVVITGDLTVDTPSLHVDSSGHLVGIGTLTPTRKLHILNAGSCTVRSETTAAGSPASFEAINDDDDEVTIIAYGTTYSGTACGANKAGMSRLFFDAEAAVIDSIGTVDLIIGTNDTAAITIDGTTQAISVASTVDGRDIAADGVVLDALVDDSAYGSGWSGDTTHGASRRAIYDQFEALEDLIDLVEASDVDSIFGRTGAVTAQLDDYTASLITNVPTAPLSSTNVQDAIDELAGSVPAGPGSSTDNAVARFDGATGLLLQSSPVAINDGGDVTGVGSLTVADNLIVDSTTLVVDSTNNRVGIGTASPASPFHLQASGFAEAVFESTLASSVGATVVKNDSGRYIQSYAYGSTFSGTSCGVTKANLTRVGFYGSSAVITTLTGSDLILGTNDTLALTIDGSSQHVSIEQDLDVAGNVQFDLGLTVDGTTLVVDSPNSKVTMSGDLEVDSTTLVVDSTNNRVGVGGAPTADLHVQGSGARTITLDSSGTANESTLNVYSAASASTARLRAYGAAAAGTYCGLNRAGMSTVMMAGTSLIQTISAYDLNFGTNDTLALTIDGSTQAATFAAPITAALENGATGSRPGSPATGQMYFDTTLGTPIWYDGSNWINSSGTTV